MMGKLDDRHNEVIYKIADFKPTRRLMMPALKCGSDGAHASRARNHTQSAMPLVAHGLAMLFE